MEPKACSKTVSGHHKFVDDTELIGERRCKFCGLYDYVGPTIGERLQGIQKTIPDRNYIPSPGLPQPIRPYVGDDLREFNRINC